MLAGALVGLVWGRPSSTGTPGPVAEAATSMGQRSGMGTLGMLRWLTAGESHGQALVAVLEGLPAGVEITTADVGAALARRRLGYGRGARMSFEQDR